MACSDAYATAQDFAQYWCIEIEPDEEARLNLNLKRTAGRIHAARQANNQCSCDLSEWGADYLAELNVIAAAVTYKCPCSNLKLTPEEKVAWLEALQNDLASIRGGQIELCSGETGAEYPYVTWAERSLTVFNTRQIVANEIQRSLT